MKRCLAEYDEFGTRNSNFEINYTGGECLSIAGQLLPNLVLPRESPMNICLSKIG